MGLVFLLKKQRFFLHNFNVKIVFDSFLIEDFLFMANIIFENLSQMNHDEACVFHANLVDILSHEDSSAADENLASGVPIYYCNDDEETQDYVIKEYPSGRKELVTLDECGEEILIKVMVE